MMFPANDFKNKSGRRHGNADTLLQAGTCRPTLDLNPHLRGFSELSFESPKWKTNTSRGFWRSCSTVNEKDFDLSSTATRKHDGIVDDKPSSSSMTGCYAIHSWIMVSIWRSLWFPSQCSMRCWCAPMETAGVATLGLSEQTVDWSDFVFGLGWPKILKTR